MTSLSLEDYMDTAKNQAFQPKGCFKAHFGRDEKRWLVYTEELSYAFLWSHLIWFTMDKSFTELVLYLSSHKIRVNGKNLEPLHKAILDEKLKFISVLNERDLMLLKETDVFIRSIQMLEHRRA